MKENRVKPMLAKLADRPFSSKDYIYEIKWDGYRAIANINKGNVDLYSRNFISFNDQYKNVVSSLEKIKENVVMDGEVVAFDESGKVGFQALQNLQGNASFVVFDILFLNGKDLRNLPLLERKNILKKFLKKYKKLNNIIESEYIIEKGEDFFKAVVKKDLEGIMAKHIDSPYISNKRTDYWLKIKHHKTEEAVIVGFTEPRGSRKYFGALVLGQYKDNELVFIGHTGTGFNELSLKELHKKMEPLINNKSPFREKISLNAPVTWIKPVLVAEIKFSEWTEGRNMRQPVFLGIRSDKKAKEVKIMEKEFTNLDKIYFPKLKISKGDVISYYERIAKYILPYLKDRPETLNRHPNGINKPNFFHKNIINKIPSFAKTANIYSESNKENINYLICNNKETLMYMANLGCIEINAWNSRVGKLDYPDYMIIDIDPDGNNWGEIVKVAKEVKKVLDESCQKSYLKTSGKSGLHICVPFGAKYSFEEVRTFCELVCRVVNSRLPDITSLERSPKKRKKKIYLDYLQNRIGQTTASVYSLRPTEEATVSTPIKWNELTLKLDIKKFNIYTIEKRLKKVGDLWKPVIKESIDLKKSIICLEKTLKKYE